MTDAQKWDTILKWSTGISVPLLLFVMSSLWSISSTAAGNAAEMSILKTKIESLEKNVSEISAAARDMRNSTVEMRVSQAGFQSSIASQIDELKTEFSVIRAKAHKIGSP